MTDPNPQTPENRGEVDPFLGLKVYDKHLATCGSIGFSGRRVGTTIAHSPQSAAGISGEPWFRFRNAECEQICREAWALPDPIDGDLFAVTDEQGPSSGTATRIDASDPLRKCRLAKWEGAAMPFGRSRFYRYDGTDLFQWHVTRDGFQWRPAGRVLKLKATPTPGAPNA